jgi:uncharacterized protein YecT (DUF1311 family)
LQWLKQYEALMPYIFRSPDPRWLVFCFIMLFCWSCPSADVRDFARATPPPQELKEQIVPETTAGPVTTPRPTETRGPLIHTVVVTQRVLVLSEVMVTVVVTPTPTPYRAKSCLDEAITNFDFQTCGRLAQKLAEEELNETMDLIVLPEDEKQELIRVQEMWREEVNRDCILFYGKLIQDEYGSMRYKRGQLAPLEVLICITDRIDQRRQELVNAYLRVGE